MNRIRPLTTVDAPKKFDFNDTKKDVEEKMEGTKDVKLTDRKDTLQREVCCFVLRRSGCELGVLGQRGSWPHVRRDQGAPEAHVRRDRHR